MRDASDRFSFTWTIWDQFVRYDLNRLRASILNPLKIVISKLWLNYGYRHLLHVVCHQLHAKNYRTTISFSITFSVSLAVEGSDRRILTGCIPDSVCVLDVFCMNYQDIFPSAGRNSTQQNTINDIYYMR